MRVARSTRSHDTLGTSRLLNHPIPILHHILYATAISFVSKSLPPIHHDINIIDKNNQQVSDTTIDFADEVPSNRRVAAIPKPLNH